MSRPSQAALILVTVLVVGIGGYLVYDTFLRGDATAALTLPSASPDASPSAPPTEAPSASGDAGATTGPTASAATGDDGLAGTWTLSQGEAGYRVREQLANLPAESDAVGRTTAVTGSISLEGSGDAVRLTGGTIEVDTTTITSDEGRRDDRMRTEGLETDAFPTATFTVTQPVDVPAAALDGTPSDVTLVGDLTLHGVTRTVAIPAQAQLVDGVISVAGATTFALSDFDIVAPNVGGFIVSIADEGTLEFLVSFTQD
jgi:polyisoprenoid-binding protein YceI